MRFFEFRPQGFVNLRPNRYGKAFRLIPASLHLLATVLLRY
jgi:hypothetical protein